MEKSKTICRGGKFPLMLAVDGLGQLALGDSNVDFSVTFFAKERNDSKVTNVYTVNKSDAGKAFADEGDDNIYYVICDTTDLDTGDLFAKVEVQYPDSNTGQTVKEPLLVDCKATVVEPYELSVKGYEQIDKLVVAGCVYAYATPSAEADTPTIQFKSDDSRKVAISTSPSNQAGVSYSWLEDVWVQDMEFTNKLKGKYVVAINVAGCPIYYHDGTKWVRKGFLFNVD